MFKASSVLSCLFFVVAVTQAVAESLTYNFEGVVEIPSPFLGDRFQVGDLVSGSFTYNGDAMDLTPGDPSIGSYLGAIESFEFQIDNYTGATIGSGLGDIQVRDGDTVEPLPLPHRDAYTVVALVNGEPVEGYDLLLGALQMLDFDGDAIIGDALTPPELDLFSDPLITIDFTPVGMDQNRVWAALTSLERVPEPSAAVLFLLGATLAGGLRRSRFAS